MKLFLKLVINDFNHATRDRRELQVVSKFNDNIIIMAKGESNEIIHDGEYVMHRRSTRPLGNHKKLIHINRLVSLFTWSLYIRRKLKPGYISCHDLTALFIGWTSTLFMKKKDKPLLIYDSHEFELGRNVVNKRSKLTTFLISKLEKFLMNKCAFSIMVNDSIAKEVKRIHKLKSKPVVVRNIPKHWNVDLSICEERKREICKSLGLPSDTFLIMYHGRVYRNRGIEKILLSLKKSENIAGIILGNGSYDYVKSLKDMTSDLGISDRVLFHKAVPIEELWQYVGAADVGMITIPAVTKSYYYMLPNKFFENIQSLTPVICSNFPEVSQIVKNYDIGLLVNPENVDEIVDAIEEMRTNKQLYLKFVDNLKKAKDELAWESESKILEEAYRKILK